VFVPGTVAGYMPWCGCGGDASPVSGAEHGRRLPSYVFGIAIILYTAFWGFALIVAVLRADRGDQNP